MSEQTQDTTSPVEGSETTSNGLPPVDTSTPAGAAIERIESAEREQAASEVPATEPLPATTEPETAEPEVFTEPEPEASVLPDAPFKVGQHYAFAADESRLRDGFVGKVVECTETRATIQVLNKGIYSDGRLYEIDGLNGEEITAETAFNLAVDPQHVVGVEEAIASGEANAEAQAEAEAKAEAEAAEAPADNA